MARPILILTLFFLCNFCLFGQENSVLSEGNWYKIAVLDKGVYRIDQAFLQNLGIDPSGIDPQNLAIYGNGGNGMLPQSNAEPRPIDLIENSIFVSGEGDGSFDSNDFLLFYGNGSDHYSFDPAEGIFNYEKNLYSDTTFYFLTIKTEAGKRITTRANAGNGFTKISSTRHLFVHEVDQTNLLRGGRLWLGEDFFPSRPERTITFESPDIRSSSEIYVTAQLMVQAERNTTMDLSLNTQTLGTVNFQDTGDADQPYVLKGDLRTGSYDINSSNLDLTNNELNLNIVYNPPSSGPSVGYIDFVKIEVENNLNIRNGFLNFWTDQSTSPATFELSSANSGIMVWDVTEIGNIQEQEYDLNGDVLSFGVESIRDEYIAFEAASRPAPIAIGRISNQNLRGLAAADALIITHRNFLSEANRLSAHRQSMVENFDVHVVQVHQIYNEFSSGMQDISAIRDFIKHIYDKDTDKLKYVLLFGDCSYDYKNRSITNTNFVPVYEARNSMHPLYNFSSDDYFGFMEENEGEWIEDEAGDHTLELGVGRITVATSTEAQNIVDKIIRYETSANSFGAWRNEMLFIADDGDSNIHQRDANILATYVETTRSEFNIDKLYIDAFEQISTPSGESSPNSRQAFEDAINDGRLMINYTGHGNEQQLTEEKIIDENQIFSLTNRNRLPFFITATCEFGNYDNPDRVSGGEKTLLNPDGGAIALLTSTRPVFSNTNFILNEAYYFAAMAKENGEFPRLGDIIRNTKNNSLEGEKNRNFALLGDPTLRLAFPKYELAITSVNGKVTNQADTMKALGKIHMAGEVRRSDNTVVDDFNGVVSVTIFDKPTKFSTLGNENTNVQQFEQRNALLFKGQATVENGFFSFEFVVPKNISYVLGEGKISMYGLDNSTTIPEDANGSNIDLQVGGTDPNAPDDSTPPEIELFMDNFDFVNGGLTGTSPLFLARLSDENGINISNQGFGGDITITINDGNDIILNEFYSANLDTFQEGLVSYPVNQLEPGNYTIRFKAYDTHNNFSESEIDFVVSQDIGFKLDNVVAFPNPISTTTTSVRFRFDHDRDGEPIETILQIINLQGEIILENSYRFDDSSTDSNVILWDAKDANGNKLENGIYIYKLLIQSKLDGAKNQVHKKLVVFN